MYDLFVNQSFAIMVCCNYQPAATQRMSDRELMEHVLNRMDHLEVQLSRLNELESQVQGLKSFISENVGNGQLLDGIFPNENDAGNPHNIGSNINHSDGDLDNDEKNELRNNDERLTNQDNLNYIDNDVNGSEHLNMNVTDTSIADRVVDHDQEKEDEKIEDSIRVVYSEPQSREDTQNNKINHHDHDESGQHTHTPTSTETTQQDREVEKKMENKETSWTKNDDENQIAIERVQKANDDQGQHTSESEIDASVVVVVMPSPTTHAEAGAVSFDVKEFKDNGNNLQVDSNDDNDDEKTKDSESKSVHSVELGQIPAKFDLLASQSSFLYPNEKKETTIIDLTKVFGQRRNKYKMENKDDDDYNICQNYIISQMAMNRKYFDFCDEVRQFEQLYKIEQIRSKGKYIVESFLHDENSDLYLTNMTK